MVLVVAGLALGGLYRVVAGTERHAYSPGAQPPSGVHVTDNASYELSVPGGVKALRDHGIDPGRLQCTWSSGGSANQLLQVSPLGADTRATNTVATFTAPFSGEVHVDCAGWGAMFIDDADAAGADAAGWLLLLATVVLTAGAGLGVSALYARRRDDATSGRSAGEDDEIERLVHVVHVRGEDGEVGGRHRGDVAP